MHIPTSRTVLLIVFHIRLVDDRDYGSSGEMAKAYTSASSSGSSSTKAYAFLEVRVYGTEHGVTL